jgi:hypothetical protein
LKIAIARRVPGAGWQAEPPFWQRRYYDRNLRDHEEFVEKLRYIRRNPVIRGLCAAPIDWPWRSFRHYMTAERGVVENESEWTAMRRGARSLRRRLRGYAQIARPRLALGGTQRRGQ